MSRKSKRKLENFKITSVPQKHNPRANVIINPHSDDELDSLFENYTDCSSTQLSVSSIANILSIAKEGYCQEQAALFDAILEKEPVLAAHLNTRMLAISSVKWNVLGGDSAEKRKIIGNIFSKAQGDKLITNLTSAIGYGYAGNIIDWVAGGASIRSFPEINPSNIRFEKNGEVVLAPSIGGETPITDENKLNYVFHFHKTKPGLPCTSGLIRTLIWTYFFKHSTVKQQQRFLEKFGMPIITAKIARNDFSDDTLRNGIKRQIRNLGQDGVGVITEDTDVNIQTPSGGGGKNGEFLEWITYNDDIYALLILGQLASSSTAGGMSNGQIQENVRTDILKSDLTALSETITTQIFNPLERCKFGTEDLYFDMTYLSTADMAVAKGKMDAVRSSGYEIDREWVSDMFGVPLKEEKEQTSSAPASVMPDLSGLMGGLSTSSSTPTPEAIPTPAASETPVLTPTIEPLVPSMQEPVAMSDISNKKNLIAFADLDNAYRDKLLAILDKSTLPDSVKGAVNSAPFGAAATALNQSVNDALISLTLDDSAEEAIRTEAARVRQAIEDINIDDIVAAIQEKQQQSEIVMNPVSELATPTGTEVIQQVDYNEITRKLFADLQRAVEVSAFGNAKTDIDNGKKYFDNVISKLPAEFASRIDQSKLFNDFQKARKLFIFQQNQEGYEVKPESKEAPASSWWGRLAQDVAEMPSSFKKGSEDVITGLASAANMLSLSKSEDLNQFVQDVNKYKNEEDKNLQINTYLGEALNGLSRMAPEIVMALVTGGTGGIATKGLGLVGKAGLKLSAKELAKVQSARMASGIPASIALTAEETASIFASRAAKGSALSQGMYYTLEGAGDMYNTQVEAGIDPRLALATSVLGGGIYAKTQLSQLGHLIPGADKLFAVALKEGAEETIKKYGMGAVKSAVDNASKGLLKRGVEFGKDTAQGIGEEVLGEMIKNQTNKLSAIINDAIDKDDTLSRMPELREEFNQYIETIKQSAGPLILMSTLGHAGNAIKNKVQATSEPTIKMDKPVMAEAVSDESQIVYDQKNGIGAMPNNQEVELGYKGFAKTLLPKEFRNLVPSGNSNEKNVSNFIELIKSKTPIGSPTLFVKWMPEGKYWQVIDHEGRSRIDAINKINPNEQVVTHFFPYKMDIDKITNEMKNAPILSQSWDGSTLEDLKDFAVKVGSVVPNEVTKAATVTPKLEQSRTISSEIPIFDPETSQAYKDYISQHKSIEDAMNNNMLEFRFIDSEDVKNVIAGVDPKFSTKGMFSVKNGTAIVYLVRDKIKSAEQLIGTLAHEDFIHRFLFGSQSPIDAKDMNTLLADIDTLSKQENNGFWTPEIESLYNNTYDVKNNPKAKMLVNEEKVAKFFGRSDIILQLKDMKQDSIFVSVFNKISTWLKRNFPFIFGNYSEEDMFKFINKYYRSYTEGNSPEARVEELSTKPVMMDEDIAKPKTTMTFKQFYNFQNQQRKAGQENFRETLETVRDDFENYLELEKSLSVEDENKLRKKVTDIFIKEIPLIEKIGQVDALIDESMKKYRTLDVQQRLEERKADKEALEDVKGYWDKVRTRYGNTFSNQEAMDNRDIIENAIAQSDLSQEEINYFVSAKGYKTPQEWYYANNIIPLPENATPEQKEAHAKFMKEGMNKAVIDNTWNNIDFNEQENIKRDYQYARSGIPSLKKFISDMYYNGTDPRFLKIEDIDSKILEEAINTRDLLMSQRESALVDPNAFENLIREVNGETLSEDQVKLIHQYASSYGWINPLSFKRISTAFTNNEVSTGSIPTKLKEQFKGEFSKAKNSGELTDVLTKFKNTIENDNKDYLINVIKETIKKQEEKLAAKAKIPYRDTAGAEFNDRLKQYIELLNEQATEPVYNPEEDTAIDKLGNEIAKGVTELENMTAQELAITINNLRAFLKNGQTISKFNSLWRKAQQDTLNKTVIEEAGQALQPGKRLHEKTSIPFIRGTKEFYYMTRDPISILRSMFDYSDSPTSQKIIQLIDDSIAKSASMEGLVQSKLEPLFRDSFTPGEASNLLRVNIPFAGGKVSKNELMAMYAYSKNENAKNHLFNTGFMKADGTKITNEDIAEVEKLLTEKEKFVVDSVINFFDTEMYPKLNEVFRRVHGVDLPKENFYFPIYNLFRQQGKEDEAGNDIFNQFLSRKQTDRSRTKERTGSEEPFYKLDFSGSFLRGISDSSKYIAYYEMLSKLNRLLDNPDVRLALKNKNPYAYDEITKWRSRIASDNKNADAVMRLMDVIKQNSSVGYIAANPASILMQFVSFLQGVYNLNPIQVGRYLKDVASNKTPFYSTMNDVFEENQFMKNRTNNFIAQVSANLKGQRFDKDSISKLVDWTKQTGIDLKDAAKVLTGKVEGKEAIEALYKDYEGATRIITDIGLTPMKMVDGMVASAIYRMKQYEYMDNIGKYDQFKEYLRLKNEAPESAEFKNLATSLESDIKKATDIAVRHVNETQSLNNKEYMSRIYASNGVLSLFTPLTAPLNQILNKSISVYGKALSQKDKQSVFDAAKWTIIGLLSSGAATALIRSGLKQPTEEEILKETFAQVSGGVPLFGPIVQYALDTTLDKNSQTGEYKPQVARKVSDAVKPVALTPITDAIDSTINLMGSEKDTPDRKKAISKIIFSTLTGLGFPVANISQKLYSGAKYNNLWNYISDEKTGLSWLSGLYNPATLKLRTSNPVSFVYGGQFKDMDNLIAEFNKNNPELKYYPQVPSEDWVIPYKGINVRLTLTNDEYEKYLDLVSAGVKNMYNAYNWDKVPRTKAAIDAIKNRLSAIRKAAKERMYNEVITNHLELIKKYEGVAEKAEKQYESEKIEGFNDMSDILDNYTKAFADAPETVSTTAQPVREYPDAIKKLGEQLIKNKQLLDDLDNKYNYQKKDIGKYITEQPLELPDGTITYVEPADAESFDRTQAIKSLMARLRITEPVAMALVNSFMKKRINNAYVKITTKRPMAVK